MLAGYIHRTLCKRVRLQDADKWTFYWHIHERILYMNSTTITWLCNKVRELIAIKVLHTSLLNTTVVAFKVLPLGSCALIPELSSPLKTILELVLWNDLQSCRRIALMSSVLSKCLPFIISFIFGTRKKSLGARSDE